jgi:hypothetical protein
MKENNMASLSRIRHKKPLSPERRRELRALARRDVTTTRLEEPKKQEVDGADRLPKN